jgi:AcrR family transcriptional regulator
MEELKDVKEEWRPTDKVPEPGAALDTAKRQQLMEGARRAFLEHGFDGASVGDIVRAAGISKGTLYAYFPSKEKLFETLVIEDRRKHSEALCISEDAGDDVPRALSQFGRNLLNMLSQPDTVAFVRIVIAASGKFPEIGRAYYEAGPARGVARLADYLRRMTAKGVLDIADPEHAARQFLDLCKSGIHVRMLLGVSQPPSAEAIAANVDSAVAVFMKAYGAPAARDDRSAVELAS